MGNPPTQLVAYLDIVLDAMVARPSTWGALGCVEQQALRLLEVRLLVSRGGPVENVGDVMTEYLDFLRRRFPDKQGVGLSGCVDDDVDQFKDALAEFTAAQRALQDGPSGDIVPFDENFDWKPVVEKTG